MRKCCMRIIRYKLRQALKMTHNVNKFQAKEPNNIENSKNKNKNKKDFEPYLEAQLTEF